MGVRVGQIKIGKVQVLPMFAKRIAKMALVQSRELANVISGLLLLNQLCMSHRCSELLLQYSGFSHVICYCRYSITTLNDNRVYNIN